MPQVVRALLLSVVAITPCACNRYEARLPETGATLEGVVTYGGEKVPMAQVNVFGPKGQGSGEVQDGKYKVENAPLGEVQIGVNTEAVKGQFISQQMARSYKGPGSKGPSGPAPKFMDVPAKYREPESSGITTTVKKGVNNFDITLSK